MNEVKSSIYTKQETATVVPLTKHCYIIIASKKSATRFFPVQFQASNVAETKPKPNFCSEDFYYKSTANGQQC